ncbi:unnamed protein product [Mortierella alpina]
MTDSANPQKTTLSLTTDPRPPAQNKTKQKKGSLSSANRTLPAIPVFKRPIKYCPFHPSIQLDLETEEWACWGCEEEYLTGEIIPQNKTMLERTLETKWCPFHPSVKLDMLSQEWACFQCEEDYWA